MKVFQGNVIDWKRSKEPHHGQCRAVIGAKNQKEAHAILCKSDHPASLYYFRNYWTETGNAAQIAAATKHPGKLLLSSSLMLDDYEPVR